MRKAFFIVNPAAAGGAGRKRWERCLPDLLERGATFEWSYTSGPYTAPEMAARAVDRGFEVIVAVGGDGTVYEVLNGLMAGDRALDQGVSLAVLPTGAQSNFARNMGITADGESLIKLLDQGRPSPVDVGRAEFVSHRGDKTVRYFLNMAEAGLGGEIISRINRMGRLFGGISFYWGAVLSIMLFSDIDMKVHMDDREYREGRHTFVALGNGRYFGGGMKICPKAEVDDGWLDVVGMLWTTKKDLIGSLHRAYRGDPPEHRRIWKRRSKKISLSSPKYTTLISLDGEQPGRLEAQFNLLPKAINLQLS